MSNFDKIIEEHNRVYIIAEIGVNHNGSKEIAYKLIDLAASAGADAVKFQMFYPEMLCSTVYRKEELNMLKEYFLDISYMEGFKAYAERKGLDFIVTPFDFKSLKDIMDIKCSIIKIGSGELTHIPFLKEAAKYDKNIILSTGASYLSDIERAVLEITKITDKTLSLLHCVSTYPAPSDALNLKAINTIKMAFPDCIIGYSDHSTGSIASSIAITLGARIVEKHITLDKELLGPDHRASSDQFEFVEMVNVIREAEVMIGSGAKIPQYCESIIGRSIVAQKDLNIGDIITLEDLDYKRPGDGIRPYEVDKFIGSKLNKNIKKDEKMEFEHIINKETDRD